MSGTTYEQHLQLPPNSMILAARMVGGIPETSYLDQVALVVYNASWLPKVRQSMAMLEKMLQKQQTGEVTLALEIPCV